MASTNDNNNWLSLKLDTTAPTGKLSAASYMVEQGTVTVSNYPSDTAKIKYWYSDSEYGHFTDENYLSEDCIWHDITTSFTTAFKSEGVHFYHAIFKDDVANEGTTEAQIANTGSITYELTDPTITDVKINGGDSYTTHRADNTITFDYSIPVSDVATATLSGTNLKNSPIDIKGSLSGTGTYSGTIEFLADEANSKVTVYIETNAGRKATDYDTIDVDATPATGTLELRKSDDSAKLGDYVKDVAFGIKITCTASDWAKYKIWGSYDGSAAKESEAEWVDVTDAQRKAGYVFITKDLTSGDGTKTIYAKIKDTAGSETDLGSKSTELDQTPPVVTLGLSKDVISKQTGYNSTVLSISCSESGSGIGRWWIILDSYSESSTANIIASGTGSATLPAEKTITYSTSTLLTEGSHTIYVKVEDALGNVKTGDNVANISLTCDYSGPTITSLTVNRPACEWYGGSNVNEGDTAGFLKLSSIVGTVSGVTDATSSAKSNWKTYCWIDGVEGSKAAIPSGYAGTDGCLEKISYTNFYSGNFVDGGTNYAHVCYIDAVGNTGSIYTSAVSFGIDTAVPGAGTITAKDKTYTKTVTVTIEPNENEKSISTAGLGWYKLYGDIVVNNQTISTASLATWTKYSMANPTITLTDGDGNKTVYVMWRDQAGNIQTEAVASKIIVLDTDDPDVQLDLLDSVGNSIAGMTVQSTEFQAKITNSEPSGAKYLLYGDFVNAPIARWGSNEYVVGKAYAVGDFVYYSINSETGEDEVIEAYKVTTAITAAENTSWDVVKNNGADQFISWPSEEKVIKISKTCTSTSGDKLVFVICKDEAGNTSERIQNSFTYDAEDPEVSTSSVSRASISKQNVQLSDGSYANQVLIKFTPNKTIKAWKLIAYKDATAAEAGRHDDTTGVIISKEEEKSVEIAYTLSGADYETALNGAGDGVHYIVIYVQAVNGNWSASAVISQ